jgi:septum formation protein
MITDQFKDYRLILASRSPRRQQLLRQLGLKFDVVIREYEETYPEGLNGEEIARFIAHEKAASLKDDISDNEIVIAADTIVWCNNKVLGKPLNRADATRILKEISGNTHEVITGVSLRSKTKELTFSESTKVTFETLTEEEIRYYIDEYKPYDKAGAYGIQEWIGYIGITMIEGSYFNVMGLPIQMIYAELKKL